MQHKPDEIANEVLREYQFLFSDRGTFDNHWTEIAQRMLPNDEHLFHQKGTLQAKGQKRTEFLFDSTASVALNRFAAILDSLLTPRNQTWHTLMASDPLLNRDRQVRLWFEDVNRLLFKYRYAPRANFPSQNQRLYRSVGAYGTGCMFVDDLVGNEAGIRYRNVHLAEVYFVENHQGIIDKAYRYFSMTGRQMIQKWGKDNVPDQVKNIQNKEQEFWVVHCVKPNTDVDPERMDYKGMPYGSYYVSVEGRYTLQQGGYHVFPYPISRYDQTPGEVYGRSPAMDILPAVKTLNEEKKMILKAGHRATDPVLLAFDDGVVDGFSLRPGDINPGGVTADGRPLVHALPTGNLQIGKELMDDERSLINDSFLISLFQILTESPQMTATEVLERTKEKGILLAPTIGRQQSEYLGPLIEREIDVLSRQGLLPPMPALLQQAKGDYHVQYDSPLSRAQRAEEASGLMRTLESTLQVVQTTQDPSPLDHFNWDTIVPAVAHIQGVPLRWLNTMDKIQQMRQQRSQQQQMQTAIQAGPAAAAMTKASVAAGGLGPQGPGK